MNIVLRSLKTALVVGGAVLIVSLVYTKPVLAPTQPAAPTVRLHGEQIRVTIADTNETREQGLSGRSQLADNEGMLFVFERDGIYPFWMKDMLFNIDIMWLDSKGSVVWIVPNATPESYPQTFTPDAVARYVLEVPAGYTAEHGIEIGDVVGL